MIKLITQLIMLSFCMPLFLLMQTNSSNETSTLDHSINRVEKKVEIVNVSELNSASQDYCPIVLDDGILFTSDRTENGLTKSGDANLFFSSKKQDGKFEHPVLYSGNLNSDFQEGMATISPDGKTLIFSRAVNVSEGDKGFSDVRLFSASWKNGEWTDIEKMSINKKDYSSGHPAFSSDGSELYFVSNRPGGFGATDIYKSNLRKGKWSKPKNLGDRVNSSDSELFPYLDKSDILYFSSNKKGGNGLLDIYLTSKQNSGEWNRPVNMGFPFNSKSNDFGFYKNEEGESGYLSSNREGGMGGNDIYAWGKDLKMPEVFTSTKIYILEASTEQPIVDAKVSMRDAFENLSEWYTDEEGKIEIDGSISELNLLTVEHEDFQKKLFDPNLIEKNIKTFSIKLANESCVKVSGQLVDEKEKPVLLGQVRIEILNLSTSETNQLYTNRDGSFEYCLECNPDYSIKAFPEGFYLGEIRMTTKDLNCEREEPIKIQIAINKINEEDQLRTNPNLSNSGKVLSPEEVVIRNAKNKTMLESISIAEEEVEDFAVEVEEEIEKIVDEPKIPEPTTKESKSDVEPPSNNFSTIPNIYYDFDSYKIKESDKKYLEDLAEYLKENPGLKLSIKSFTDTKGRKAYNKWLSKRRAQAVMEHLMTKGIEKARLDAVGKGELDATIAVSSDESERRRTEFELLEITNNKESISSYEKNETPIRKNEVYISKIYYNFNDHSLNDLSIDEVDKVIEQLNQNLDLKVEIRSHTDSRGTSSYNKWLSQERANKVIQYMKSKGVDAARLSGKGFGEAELINECADGVSCSKEAHSENRRTEFVFL